MKPVHLIFGCIFLVAPLLGARFGDSEGEVSQKSAFMDRLDSIDMEKQIRKRKGQSLDDLEKKSLLIKDSISALKKDFDRAGGTPVAPKTNATAIQRLLQANHFLPHNAFDWVVFIFAAIALIAGAILCIGLISMLLKTMKSNKTTPIKTLRENLSLRDQDAPSEHVPASAERTSALSERRIDSLKKRMSETSESSGNPPGKAFPGSVFKGPAQEPVVKAETQKDSSASDTTPISSAKQGCQPSAVDLKDLILKAALEGANTTEISKKFHVSVDQVSLILRVAHRDDANKA
jgi:hypothetical protein